MDEGEKEFCPSPDPVAVLAIDVRDLPAGVAGPVAELAERLANARRPKRGRTSKPVLFEGGSATGKTMAAAVIGKRVNVPVWRIDLASQVSKYIGETEKNLRGIFDRARTGRPILYFDEAEALFGKRSEPRDAHDRYANLAIACLMRRIETYSGIAILASNRPIAIDHAMHFATVIRFPGSGSRRRSGSRQPPLAAKAEPH